jgi:pimeloyl-ACP methyl ester carboxylesterase
MRNDTLLSNPSRRGRATILASAVLALVSPWSLWSDACAAATKSARAQATAAMAANQKIAPGGIDVLKSVDIGGIPQWISVRGSDPRNPILLYLHGGPGAPMMAESWTYQRPWEDFFTVVQWDQRGSGKTFSSAHRKLTAPLSVDRIVADAEELIQYLRREYHQDKIFVLGHSFGSTLGVRVAQDHPEWLYAYIGVGQMVNGRANEAVGYQQTLAEARRRGNRTAIRELESIAPYPNADGSVPTTKTVLERKWDVMFGGMIYALSDDDESQRRWLSPLYDDQDLRSAEIGEDLSFETLWSQVTAVKFDDVNDFRCPVFIFAGRHDRTTPTTLVEPWFAKLRAPVKKLFLIEHAAHYVVSETPGEVLVDLVENVRPLATRTAAP